MEIISHYLQLVYRFLGPSVYQPIYDEESSALFFYPFQDGLLALYGADGMELLEIPLPIHLRSLEV